MADESSASFPGPRADIGVTGLAVMGRNLARNFARNGHVTALYNRTQSRVDELIEQFGDEGDFVPSTDLKSFVASLKRPRRIMIMVKAGKATDAVIDELVPLLEEGDIVIDGGNAHFDDTRRREQALKAKGLHFVGTGVSGGEEGALNGPSIMPGGSKESYEALGPILESIAVAVDGTPCCTYVGPDGAGHFVKMVHNGIEYADMQLIAEAYELLRQGLGKTPAELADVFRTWNEGDLESFLIEITARVLDKTHPGADGSPVPLVDLIVDAAEQKGTGRWTVQTALELGVPTTGIAEAVFARSLSGSVDQRKAVQAAGTLVGPTGGSLAGAEAEGFVDAVRDALYASKVVAYAQGFDMIQAGSDQYGWDVDKGAMATIWRGGCIIRAQFLNRIKEAYDKDAHLASLLLDEYFAAAVGNAQDSWRRVVATAVRLGIPVPGFSSALSYYDGLRRERLGAALVQGQRDLFGAHTYGRVDKPGTFHTLWSGDGSEERQDAH
ncbi:6-phosphogluconate dehydrogenase [Quadrisphaera granulorum]|uniref:6-phosphogluconate dehydrogenase, decarboxylating n=1 Tax=Quadrisphaera granulorum TaxID=317664 RepID=A0A316ADM7_9ACTN|nr:NADP-dependent phosphogluconate dehydrogenase [Quadrisphaera granulorum]PWJ55865.1 6-phosphogluconate dehydrogenase [Quadrisphaera granulorum]SZE95362.1 6-phosphogluconate dehydrogenase [Quadrisphaera granulorum]